MNSSVFLKLPGVRVFETDIRITDSEIDHKKLKPLWKQKSLDLKKTVPDILEFKEFLGTFGTDYMIIAQPDKNGKIKGYFVLSKNETTGFDGSSGYEYKDDLRQQNIQKIIKSTSKKDKEKIKNIADEYKLDFEFITFSDSFPLNKALSIAIAAVLIPLLFLVFPGITGQVVTTTTGGAFSYWPEYFIISLILLSIYGYQKLRK